MLNLINPLYIPFICAGVFALGVYLYHLWQFHCTTSKQDAQTIAQDLIEQHGNKAGYYAYVQEDRAWRRCETVEQGKWRKIRIEIERIG